MTEKTAGKVILMKKWYDEEYEFTVEVTGFLHGDHTERYCRNGEEIGDRYTCTYGCPVNQDGYGICSKTMMMLYPLMEAVRSGGDLENLGGNGRYTKTIVCPDGCVIFRLTAPSGCNKQTASLIAVDDETLLARLHQVIDPPVAETAPAMICVLTRRINAYRDRCFATQDYSAAIENMLLAIAAMGYQSCWYEGHITDEDRIRDRIAGILGVPDEYELVCILPVGIAESAPAAPKKKPFEEQAWFNGFGPGADSREQVR